MSVAKWEHKAVYAYWSTEKIGGRKTQDWFVKYTATTYLVGWHEILSTFGDTGWELVAVVPEYSSVPHSVNYTGFRLFFKRPV